MLHSHMLLLSLGLGHVLLVGMLMSNRLLLLLLLLMVHHLLGLRLLQLLLEVWREIHVSTGLHLGYLLSSQRWVSWMLLPGHGHLAAVQPCHLLALHVRSLLSLVLRHQSRVVHELLLIDALLLHHLLCAGRQVGHCVCTRPPWADHARSHRHHRSRLRHLLAVRPRDTRVHLHRLSHSLPRVYLARHGLRVLHAWMLLHASGVRREGAHHLESLDITHSTTSLPPSILEVCGPSSAAERPPVYPSFRRWATGPFFANEDPDSVRMDARECQALMNSVSWVWR